MPQKQKRRIVATFEGHSQELEGKRLADEIGQFAEDKGLESFEVTASSGGSNFERVTPEMLEEKAEQIRQVRLYRVEKAG